MNPSGTSRPVMDVAAPRPPQSAMPPRQGQLAVQPAPLAAEPPKSNPILAPKQKTNAQAIAQPRSGAPVGVITVAVLAMMLLSAAAVIVYATSQSA